MTADERRILKQLVSKAAKRRAIVRSQRERWLKYVVLERQ